MDDNISDLLTVHHSDLPELVLVSKPIEEHNYGQWSRSIRIALSAKNKLGFIDGTIKPPASTDAKSAIWQKCNDIVIVLSWILQSLNPDIASSVLYCINTCPWCGMILRTSSHKAMTSKYFKSAKKLIIEHRQGHLMILVYYTKLEALWDEFNYYNNINIFIFNFFSRPSLMTMIT
jgi:hypothetical protein